MNNLLNCNMSYKLNTKSQELIYRLAVETELPIVSVDVRLNAIHEHDIFQNSPGGDLKIYKQCRRRQPLPFFILICLMRPTPKTLETSSLLKIPTYGYSCDSVGGKRLSIKVVVAQFQNISLLFTCKAYRMDYWPK